MAKRWCEACGKEACGIDHSGRESNNKLSLTDILWRELKDEYFHVKRLQDFTENETLEEWQEYQLKLIKESQDN